MYKRQIYQIAESNRIEKNRFGCENRIESKLFFPNWNALPSAQSDSATFGRGVLEKGYRRDTRTDFEPKYVKRRDSAQEIAFWGYI